MSTNAASPTRLWSRETLRFLAILLLVHGIAFAPVIFSGRFLSGADLAFAYPPIDALPEAKALPHAPNKMFGDASFQNEPWSDEAARQIWRGEMPLWNPYAFAGAPLLGNAQSAPLHPPNLLHLVLPRGAANLPIALLKLVVAGLFTALLARRLGLGFAPSALAGVAFSLLPWIHLWLLCTPSSVGTLLPIALFAAEALAAAPSIGAAVALAAILALEHFAGHPETAFYATLFTALWFAHRVLPGLRDRDRRAGSIRSSGLFVAAGIASVLLAAVQVLPFLDYLRQSATWRARSANPPHAALWLAISWRLLSFGLPNFFGSPADGDYRAGLAYRELVLYVGVPTLVLAVCALAATSHRRDVRFLLVTALVFLVIGLRPAGVSHVVRWIPLVGLSASGRLTLIVGFCLALASAFGLEALIRARSDALLASRVRRLGIGAATILALVVAVLAFVNHSYAAKLGGGTTLVSQAVLFGSLLVVSTAIVVLAPSRPAGIVGAAAIALVAADLVFFERPLHPALDPKLHYPDAPSLAYLRGRPGTFRIAASGKDFPPNLATIYGIEDVRGDDALTPWRYDLLVRRMDARLGEALRHRLTEEQEKIVIQFFETGDEKLLEVIPRTLDRERLKRKREEWTELQVESGAPIEPAEYFRSLTRGVAHEILLHDLQAPLLDLLGVRYVLASSGAEARTLREPRFREVYSDDVRIVENVQAMPRAFFVGEVEVVESTEAALDRLVQDDFDFRRRAVLEERPDPEPSRASNTDRVEIVARESNGIVVECEADGPRVLVVTDTFVEGVVAEVDGEPRPVLAADVAFRGVALAAGRHRVRIAYEPASFRIGVVVSLASVVSVIALAFVGARRRVAVEREK